MPLVVAAFGPGVLWLWWFAHKAGRSEVSWPHLSALFVLGALAAGLVLLFESTAVPAAETLLAGLSGPWSPVARAILGIGLVEETGKLTAVLLLICMLRRPSGPVQGVLWAVAAAVGFASVENCLFLQRDGLAAVVLRGPVSTFAHAAFSSVWGCALGMMIQTSGPRRMATLAAGLLIAALAHGTFNLIVLASTTSLAAAPLVFLVIPLLLLLYHFVSRALAPHSERAQRAESGKPSHLVLANRFLSTRR